MKPLSQAIKNAAKYAGTAFFSTIAASYGMGHVELVTALVAGGITAGIAFFAHLPGNGPTPTPTAG